MEYRKIIRYIIFSNIIFLFLSVTAANYEGYWIQTPDEKLVECHRTNEDETSVNCEYADCIVNCHGMYQVDNVTIALMRDARVKGYYNRVDSIQWEDNTSWKKKRQYRAFSNRFM